MENRLYPEHYLGALNELKAAHWFLENNMQVYMPVVQQSCVDFVVDYEGLKRVQVKTGTINKRENMMKDDDYDYEDEENVLGVVSLIAYKNDTYVIKTDLGAEDMVQLVVEVGDDLLEGAVEGLEIPKGQLH